MQDVEQRLGIAQDRGQRAQRLVRRRQAADVEGPRRHLPQRQQPEARQQRRQARGSEESAHAHGCSLRAVHQPLDVDHEGLIAPIDQQLGAPARTRQIDVDDRLDAAGRARQHHDAVGEEHRLLHAVGDEQHGLAVALPDLEQLVLQARARVRIERAEGLVHQQDVRAVGQRAGDGDALLHAARQLLGIEMSRSR